LGYHYWIMLRRLAIVAGISLIVTVILVARYDKMHDGGGKGYDIKCEQSSQPPFTVSSLVCEIDHSQDAKKSKPNPPWWHEFFAWPEGITALLIMLTLGAIIWQAWETRRAATASRDAVTVMQAQIDQTADVRWDIKGYPVNEICRIQAFVVNLSDRPMTIINAQVAIQGEPAKSIPRNTIIDSSAPYSMNFEIPMGAFQLWEFVPTVKWSIIHEDRITRKPVPRSLTGELHFWKRSNGQWGASFDPSSGHEPDQKNNEQPN
jgi:hypothetical protein